MSSVISYKLSLWPLWKKVLFRFFFIYLLFQVVPALMSFFPGIRALRRYYNNFLDFLVNIFNANLFHVKKVLIPVNQNIDSSRAWAQQWFFLCIVALGCFVWSVLDRKRKNYIELNYWLCLSIRYGLAVITFGYGFEKVFALQIPFPNASQMATPLGDLLPMRLYWVSIGYSTTYQIFAGLAEVFTAILLLYRKTVTLGALMGLAVFTNILLMNLGYDIPVKILSMNLVLLCLYLIANEYYRIICFFILNKSAPTSNVYDFVYRNNSLRIFRLILKSSFILVIASNFYGQWQKRNRPALAKVVKPIKAGVYDVLVYAINNKPLLPLITDSIRWQDIIFHHNNEGSIKTADTSFRQQYKRGYFIFTTDTLKHIINFRKGKADSQTYRGIILSLNYKILDSNSIELWGKKKSDSLYVLLKRSNRRFALDERQFNWLTEYHK